MKKVLGLDLGSSSIGWAFITESEQGSTIKRLGVRVIPINSEIKDKFSKGQAVSVNKDRTLKRTARKNNHRYKQRRKKLIAILEKHQMMPDALSIKFTNPIQLFGLRARAVTEQITLQEFGRILLLLNQKRGYQSSRKSNNEEDEGKKVSDYLEEIKSNESALKEKNLTIGQFFAAQFTNDPHTQVKKRVFPRSSYVAEFDRIWATQQAFYPEVLTEELRKQLCDETIFFQRKLKSQKHLVSACRFEPNHKVAPKSSPLFQIERIWEAVHTISVSNKRNEQFEISPAKKLDLANKLLESEKIGSKDVFKILGIPGRSGWHTNEQIEKSGIKGNITLATLKKKFKQLDIDRPDLLRFELKQIEKQHVDKETGEVITWQEISPEFEYEPLYQLWHLLYSVDEPAAVIQTLVKRYGFTQAQAEGLSQVDFSKDGYGSKSTKALRKLLPGLMHGLHYADAAKQAGYKHSDSLTVEEKETRTLQTRLAQYQKNSLRQPVVEKVLNQLVNLVNAIIEDEQLGAPDEIRIELARELQANREDREKEYKRNNDTEKKHLEIKERIEREYPGIPVTRKVIEKYKLYEQQNGRCLYSNKGIDLAKALRGEGIDVDHIIPQSRIFDDSFQNKVLVYREENATKDNETAFDYMQAKSEEALNTYLEQVNELFEKKSISKAKRNRLLWKGIDIPDDFINRQLNETRYITREASRLLLQICREVQITSGGVTSFLRKTWGYDEILKQLNWDKYEKAGLVKDGKIENWSKRDDHRHHAIDALVVAATTRSFIQRLNTLNSQITRDTMALEIKGFSTPELTHRRSLLEIYVQKKRPFQPHEIKHAVSQILISFKAGKRLVSRSKNTNKLTGQVTLAPRGFLHKESVFGKIKRYSATKTALNVRFKPELVELIANPKEKLLVQDRLTAVGHDPKKAFKDPIWLDDAKTKALSEVTLWEDVFVYKYKLDQNFKAKDIPFIIDAGIREKVRQRFEERADQKDHPLKNIEQDPIWLNEAKRIPIRSVRCDTQLKDLVPLHRAENGITGNQSSVAGEKAKAVDYVSTRNNHHIAVYRTPAGKLEERAITFWEAVERRNAGFPAIIDQPKAVWEKIWESGFDQQSILRLLPESDWTLEYCFEQNAMFVFNMSADELQQAVEAKAWERISPNLYRVQNISEGDFIFRHHLETKLEKPGKEKESMATKKLIRITSLKTLITLQAAQVKLNALGEVK